MRAFFLLLIAMLVPVCAATSWYVDGVSGSDANPGTILLPFETVQKGGDVAVSGDTVFVRYDTYVERVRPAASGVKFIGINAGSTTNTMPVIRGFNMQDRDDWVICGFYFTHPIEVNYDPVFLSGADNFKVIENYFVTTDPVNAAISVNGSANNPANNGVVRGNVIIGSGFTPVPDVDKEGVYLAGTNNIIEYNYFSKQADYIRIFGYRNIVRNNYAGPSLNSDFAGAPHVDVIQNYSLGASAIMGTTFTLVENNLSVSNLTDNSHFVITQNSGTSGKEMGNWLVRRNAIMHTGDYTYIVDSITNFLAYNESIVFGVQGHLTYDINITTGVSGTNTIGTTNMAFINTIYYQANKNVGGLVYSVDSPFTNTFRGEGNMAYLSGTPQYNFFSGNTVGTDPLFNDLAAFDMTLQAASTARNVAVAQTTAVGAGVASTSLTVTDSRYFTDGWGISVGDEIIIASNDPVLISAIDYDAHVITLATAKSWSNGDGVWLDGTKDRGAFPYKAGGYTIAATIARVGDNYTVSVNDESLVRFVDWFEDGVPIDETGYTYASNGGEVVAIVRPYYPSLLLGIQAEEVDNEVPVIIEGNITLSNNITIQ